MDCNRDTFNISKNTVYFSLLIVVVKVSSLFPVFQGLASECCRFYNILISTETKQPPPDASTSVDTSVLMALYWDPVPFILIEDYIIIVRSIPSSSLS